MTLSARNRLVGKVTEIEFGGVVAHVVMRGGDNVIESVITERGAEEMGLKVGFRRNRVYRSNVGEELALTEATSTYFNSPPPPGQNKQQASSRTTLRVAQGTVTVANALPEPHC